MPCDFQQRPDGPHCVRCGRLDDGTDTLCTQPEAEPVMQAQSIQPVGRPKARRLTREGAVLEYQTFRAANARRKGCGCGRSIRTKTTPSR